MPGGDGDRLVWVGVRGVPVGWVGAVDVIQGIARHIVFKIARLPPSSEVKPHGEFRAGDGWALVYLDKLEVVRRVQTNLRHEAQQKNNIPQNELRRRFVDASAELRLPLAVGKRVVCATGGPMLGGEFDVVRGTFGHCRKKGHRTPRRVFALLAMSRWSVGSLQW